MEQRRGRSYIRVCVLKKQKQTGVSAVFYLKSSILAQGSYEKSVIYWK